MIAFPPSFGSGNLTLGSQLRVVRNFWVKSDAKGAVEAVAKMGDNAVLADVLRVMMTKKDSLSTEVCTALFPLMKDLLSSQYVVQQLLFVGVYLVFL